MEELEDEVEEILGGVSDITPSHPQLETKRPRVIQAYKELRSEKSSTGGYLIIILNYARPPFRDFESHLRFVVGLDEDDIQLFLKQNKSYFITFELSLGNYTIKDNSEVVYIMGDHEGTVQFKNDDISNMTIKILTSFGRTFLVLTFVEKAFFINL